MKVSVAPGTMTLVPDQKLLTDPSAVLPIHIDPSWTGSVSGSSWTSVWSKFKTKSMWKNSTALTDGKTFGSAGAGRTEDCSGCSDHIVRSLFRMDISKVKGKHILDAKFRIEQRHSWTCSPKSNAKLWLTGAISDKTTWNNQPTWYKDWTAQTAANRKNGSVHGCSGPGGIEFPVTSMVAHSNKSTTMTVGLKAIDEGTKNQWKRFNHSSPKLAITYNTKPNAPADRKSDGEACATGANRPYVLTNLPILAAKHSDPDSSQQSLTTYFYWWASGGSRSESNKISQSAGNPSTVSKTIPTGRIADNTTYIWQARTWDGTDHGDWSGTCEFTTDLTAPGAPTSVAVGAVSEGLAHPARARRRGADRRLHRRCPEPPAHRHRGVRVHAGLGRAGRARGQVREGGGEQLRPDQGPRADPRRRQHAAGLEQGEVRPVLGVPVHLHVQGEERFRPGRRLDLRRGRRHHHGRRRHRARQHADSGRQRHPRRRALQRRHRVVAQRHHGVRGADRCPALPAPGHRGGDPGAAPIPASPSPPG